MYFRKSLLIAKLKMINCKGLKKNIGVLVSKLQKRIKAVARGQKERNGCDILMELVTLGNGLGVSLTPRSLVWAIVEESIITYYLGEEERWSSIHACLTDLLVD